MYFKVEEVWSALPLMLQGALITFEISILGILVGLFVGTTLFLLRHVDFRPIYYFVTFYISVIRGTPLLVQIMVVYYAAPILGIDLPAKLAGIIALGLNSAGYVVEILRGGLAAVSHGHIEAARALGIGQAPIWRRIILPQVFIAVIPALTNEFTQVLKASPLLSVITVVELTRTAQQIMNVTYRPVEVFVAAAVLYFIMCFILSIITRHLEYRFQSFRVI